ncbi:DUF2059 domain-containing protein [Sandaracinobacteroides saxicola]|uniref:DUF2059 domain-containing protein n=1 Tax=Sandaracinobacteroides saxicola TaxID=2759707 RepID=A0A7G5IFV4_9SPHN|nr:DUF2059 domain-containing protein [Sandaracinobacteroides saxicola]QMW22246.1 DUF2059 domain-containing protein [Sandaracinobacteroides saxicola]
MRASVALLALVAPPALAEVPAAKPSPASLAAQLADVLNDGPTLAAASRQDFAPMLAEMRSGTAIRKLLEPNQAYRTEVLRDPAKVDAAIKRIGGMQAAVIEGLLADFNGEVRAATIDVYAASFSEAEMRDILAFYKSPGGRALVERMAAVRQSVRANVRARLTPRISAALQALSPVIEAEMRALLPAPDSGKAGQ